MREYWDSMEIAYRPAYAFEEVLAAFGDATGVTGAADTMLSQVEAMAQRITNDDSLRMPEIIDVDRRLVKAKFALGERTMIGQKAMPRTDKGVADDGANGGRASEHRAAETDPADTEFLRGVLAKEQLWRISGFRWRQLLSRRELDLLSDDDRKRFGRTVAFYVQQSELAQTFFHAVHKAFAISLSVGLVSSAYLYLYFNFVYSSAVVSGFYLRLPEAYILVFFGGWFASSLLFSIVWSGKNLPYGLRPLQVLHLILSGPFRSAIRDYDPRDDGHRYP